MNYYNRPKIDKNKINSDKSERALKDIFTYDCGFVVREDIPDYGVDYQVELVNGDQCTNNRFPIQLKSTINLNFVEHEGVKYVSYQFETSRLAYLSDFTPTYGLIVIYDSNNGKMYYGYTNEIIDLLDEVKGTPEWRKNKMVNIYILASQILDRDSVIDIHKVFMKRYKRTKILIMDRGESYGIPIVNDKSNINTKYSKLEVIRENGRILVHSRDFKTLHNLYENLCLSDLIENLEVILVSIVYFAEIGRYIDAGYLIKKGRKYFDQYSENDIAIIELSKIRINFVLKDISYDEYLDQLNILKGKTIEYENKVNIEIQIATIGFISGKVDDVSQVIDDITKLYREIMCKMEDSKHKYSLLLYMNRVMFHVSMDQLIKSKKILDVNRSKKSDMNTNDEVDLFKSVMNILNMSNEILKTVMDYARSSKDIVLSAQCDYSMALNFTNLVGNITLLNTDAEEKNKMMETEYKSSLEKFLRSYTIFIENADIESAYNALYYYLELESLYCHNFKVTPELIDRSEIEALIKALINKLDLEPYKSEIEEALKKKQESETKDLRMLLHQMTISEIEEYVDNMCSKFNFPNERVQNVKRLFLDHKRFYDKYPKGKCELIEYIADNQSDKDWCKEIPEYYIKCCHCNYKTSISSNLDGLMYEYSFFHYSCK